MIRLKSNTKPLTLGRLKKFLNEKCKELPDNTIIDLDMTGADCDVEDCYEVIADEDSVRFYNYQA